MPRKSFCISDIKVNDTPKISKPKFLKPESSSRKNESIVKIDKKKTKTSTSCLNLKVPNFKRKSPKNKQQEQTDFLLKQEKTIVVPKHGTKKHEIPEMPEMPDIENLNIGINLPEQDQNKVNIILLKF